MLMSLVKGLTRHWKMVVCEGETNGHKPTALSAQRFSNWYWKKNRWISGFPHITGGSGHRGSMPSPSNNSRAWGAGASSRWGRRSQVCDGSPEDSCGRHGRVLQRPRASTSAWSSGPEQVPALLALRCGFEEIQKEKERDPLGTARPTRNSEAKVF